jgi:hypothetical protein
MGSIYQNAYLVVVAMTAEDDAADDAQGFLTRRPEQYAGISLESSKETGAEAHVIMRRQLPHLDRPSSLTRSTAKTSMKNSITCKRAWCMQETSLARRTVSFHYSEMLWECCSALDCECGRAASTPDQVDTFGRNFDTLNTHLYSQLLSARFAPMTSCVYVTKPYNSFENVENVFEEWRLMTVPLYTSRDLSKSSDRLPALSAMAQTVSSILELQGGLTKPQYLAGIWRDDVKLSLLWHVGEMRAPFPPAHWIHKPDGGLQYSPEDETGPSFSWASVGQHVSYGLTGPVISETLTDLNDWRYGDIDLHLLDARTDVIGANPMGQVSGCFIQVSGLYLGAVMETFGGGEDSLYCLTSLTGGKTIAFMPDTVLRPVDMIHMGQQMITANRCSVSDLPEPSYTNPLVNVDCLVVADAFGTANDILPWTEGQYEWIPQGVQCRNLAMLVLGRVITESGEMAYQRIGLGTLQLQIEDPKDRDFLAGATTKEFLII